MFIKKNKELFIAPVVVALILLAIYAVKGVYPFGDVSIAYYDMNVSFVPLYTHAYDVFHGNASLYYDWYTGMGSNFMGTMASFTLSPFNLFFLFVKRDMILESMSFFLMFKMILMSFTMGVYVKKTYKEIHPVYCFIAAMLYAFSGYVVMYYTNIYFLDTVVLFPILMLGLNSLLKDGKCRLYLIMLVLTFISGPYLSIMVCFFIFLYSSGYIWFCSEKDNRKRAITNLGIYTVAAILISSVVLIPTILKWAASSRIDTTEGTTYKDILSSLDCEFLGCKLGMLYCTEAGFASLLLCAVNIKKNKLYRRELFARLYVAVLLLLPIAVESINLLWHTGSYVDFPYRFGFILSFEALDAMLFFSDKHRDEPLIEIFKNKPLVNKIICLLALAVFVVYMGMSFVFGKNFYMGGIFNTVGYVYIIANMILAGLLLYAVILLIKKRTVRHCFLVVVVLLQTIMGGYGFIAPTAKIESKQEMTDVGVGIRQNIGTDKLTRIKNYDNSYKRNYPLILGVPSMIGWTNEMSTEFINECHRLGYGEHYNSSVDLGGTALSDALLNNRYSISKGELNEALYEKKAEVGEYNLYEHKYRLPLGIFVSDAFVNAELSEDSLQNQNILYEAMSGDTEELIEVSEVEDDNTQYTNGSIRRITKYIDGRKTVYIQSHSRKPRSFAVSVNGAEVKVPDKLREEDLYPSYFNNGLLELGTFENEDVTVEISWEKSSDFSDLSIGYMDNDKLSALCESYKDNGATQVTTEGTKISFTASPTSECYAFIPVEYDKNWKVSVNGKSGEVIPVLDGSFMAVKLDKGDNDVRLVYRPMQIYIGMAVSLLGVLLLVFVNLKKIKEWISNCVPLQYLCLIAFNLLSVAVLSFIYAIPLIWFVYSLVRNAMGV